MDREFLTTRLHLIALICALAWIALPAAASERVALVVGNGNYEYAPALRNPVNDAADIAAKLEQLEFKVFTGTDLTGVEMRELIVEFGRATTDAEIAMFFFAGHGIQANGENYLVPIEADIAFEEDIGITLIPVSQILRVLGRARKSRLVFLDACRDNPFKRRLMESMGLRGANSLRDGLGEPKRIPDSFVAYATQPDAVAFDGRARNSPFTTALLQHIDVPGQSIHDLMYRVGRDVRAATEERQEPWSSSSLREPFFFKAPEPDSNAAEIPPLVREFSAAQQAGTREAWRDFVMQFEKDPAAEKFISFARAQLSALTSTSDTSTTAADSTVASSPPTQNQGKEDSSDQKADRLLSSSDDEEQTAAAKVLKEAPTPGEWSIQIASQPSLEAARGAYKDLARRYNPILATREAVIVKAEIPGHGVYYRVRVRAGSRADAIGFCEQYKNAGGNCFVSR